MPTRRAIIALAFSVQALAAGCGRVDLATVGPSLSDVPTAPQVEQSEPVVVSPTPAPIQQAIPPLQMGQLTAVLSEFDKPGFLGLVGHATAHVTVTNSTQVPLTGTVTVQFTDGGSPNGTPQTQQVSVAAAQSDSLTFTESVDFHFVDGASVSVATNAPAGNSAPYGVPGTSVPGLTGPSSSTAIPGY
ncbi:MAG: hypothetical protein KGR26_15485 [Cyanobacteria bacterium REEB65]|nr:hypothetical protein [Cyanobacteria bacterium REEB65]